MLQVNELPRMDRTDNLTGCCPRFQPADWDGEELRFEHKPFVRASTRSLFHIPLNMGAVFKRTWRAIEQAHAEQGGTLVLSHDDSPWHADHLFAVDHAVPGADMVHLSGTFLTRVFDGPFSESRNWCRAMEQLVQEKGKRLEKLFFFYTTCPRCAKAYGHNYVVGLAQVR